MYKIINIIVLIVVIFGIKSLFQYQYGKDTYKQTFSELSVKEQYDQLECLSQNIYFESASESLAGKIAVAQITINRVESKKNIRNSIFKDTICKVVYQDSQFSWVKNKPKRLVNINKRVYNDSREVAKKVLFEGERIASLDKPNVLYYHAEYVKPSWANEFKFVAKIGKHLYYERKDNGKW